MKITDYKCLSEKDRVELKEWFKNKNKPKPKKKAVPKSKLDLMGLALKGKSYQEFLNSEYWSIVRSRVLKRDKCCVICKSNKNLHIHHDTYKNHFKEHKHLSDLMVLCAKCHKEHHYAQY